MRILVHWTIGLAMLAPFGRAGIAYAQTRIAYSDLTSGPATGGEGNQGAIVTVAGNGFGDVQGSSKVMLAGSPVGRILQWADRRISFQIGAAAKSGEIRVVAGGVESNPVEFTVVKGSIRLVSASGHDQSSGSWGSPWKTIAHAAHAMEPGDIAYVLDGVRQTSLDGYNAALSIQKSGAVRKPIALVAYPGAIAEIGDTGGPEFGARTPAIHGGPFNDWVIAGFKIRGANTALRLDLVQGWRIVNNDFSCPNGDGASACVEVSGSSAIVFVGNAVHDTGRAEGSKRYQSVYFTTDTNHVEIGWNHIFRNRSCRGIQIHSSPLSADSGFNQYDFAIHNNVISDQACDGINLATIDPSKGKIVLFNNLIFHVGIGPAPHDGESNYSCISSPGIVNRGTPGTGTVEIYNNTLSDCGSFGGATAGAFSVGPNSPDLLLRDNLVVQVGEPYFSQGSALGKVHGSTNLWSGTGPGPSETSGNLEGAPHFLNGAYPYELSAQSPAKNVVKACLVEYDLVGVSRNPTPGCSIGAYQ